MSRPPQPTSRLDDAIRYGGTSPERDRRRRMTLALLTQGYRIGEIADKLLVHRQRVNADLSELRRLNDCRTNEELVAWAVHIGEVQP